MTIDVTDATFNDEVVERSKHTPVVVDVWAPWCGPCKQLGPLLESVIDATKGQVVLAKVNVDENPAVGQAFKVQSIPAVYAFKDGAIVGEFLGAQGEAYVQEFVDRLLPTVVQTEVEQLIQAGDEVSLQRALELEPDNASAITGLAQLLVEGGDSEAALALLDRIPETAETRRVAAAARTAVSGHGADDVESQLVGLLDRVKADDDARQQFVDLLEVMGPDDPRTAGWRKQLTARLF